MQLKIDSFTTASQAFSALVALDLTRLGDTVNTPILIDGIRNGRAQKLELTAELCWKAMKAVLKQRDGIDEASPKAVVKAFFIANYINELQYLGVLQAIDDRNQLSHVYDEPVFESILARLPAHATLFKEISDIFTSF